ncbi:MAG: 16S rRNA (cytidine(1402)-2'-O)-methyltransferase [Acidobacteria bacterium]|nr:16S rRNA (cytidine(1402)-2'-O)-methyltransferase [Acidobacteriota bacterium]
MPGTLYLVATPIGNLQDMTFRAVEVLRSVDVIAAEDTRHTQKLLNYFRIFTRQVSFHEHNEKERAEQLADKLVLGASIAVVSDAGTPGISDPGHYLVKRAIEVGAKVVPIPGAVAFVSAAIASGLDTKEIHYAGFLPAKKGERRKRLEEVSDIPATLVLYEAPHRIAKSLADCAEILGDRPACVARELTKLHEEIARGSLSELAERFSAEKTKGEIVLVVAGSDGRHSALSSQPSGASLPARVTQLESEGLDHKAALKKAAKEFGLSKSEAYRQLLNC